MAQDEDKPSGATLGYLAPICVAIFFIMAWLVFGTRQRFRAHNRQIDHESWPLGFPRIILSPADLDARFPIIKYGDWSTAHQEANCKETEVDLNTSQGPASPSADADDKETEQNDKSVENGILSSHGNSHNECAICMEDFDDDDSIRALTCAHVFHATCLDPWFTKRQARCPLCKTSYPPEPSSSAPTRPAAAVIRNHFFPRGL
ncbi:putative RING finger protein [Aspergillus puulaauensis]|uniref:RING-type E3 ubiquitin transferase n=1 Tax=Aspergillus puulaauensis TaxID=1220207 RepID=A0A7R7XHG0_9EURO|nr:uncharacterized protein APUU_21465S [Aspergillus puulaauensis]BCS21033.1 hypothetical protein APUU_21465S [Aspergillus puulaauensis]